MEERLHLLRHVPDGSVHSKYVRFRVPVQGLHLRIRILRSDIQASSSLLLPYLLRLLLPLEDIRGKSVML